MQAHDEGKFEMMENSKHGDAEAISVDPVLEEIDPEVERRVRRKLDVHLVPLVGVLYLLAFLDRSNIGFVYVLPVSSTSAKRLDLEMRASLVWKKISS
ncbi:hypothetical protein IAQ61_006611 [Plenodomus lingam]|uniref:uncharacterized protein n=1 Tax=Leptosphaeria maculans TaxID=5022 RepID=UPI00331A53B6|nr:hypothetical protein IAQ61_006611 [Plenodomus lingam]